MAIFRSLVKKEALHIVRDGRTMVITLLMPLVLLLLFGFAISTEVKDVRLVAVVDRHSPVSRDILERFNVNDYFTFKGVAPYGEAEQMLRSGKADAVLVLRTDGETIRTQIIVDASNTTSAQAVTAYIKGVLSTAPQTETVITRTLYNPQMNSAYNFVPGIMGMIFILICAIMTSVSIVREKENGTMNLLLVSPVRPRTIILGKLVPYFLLSCVILSVMLVIAYTVLGLPPASAGILNVVLISLIYIVLSLSIGLLVSALVDSQLSALIVSAVMFMLPVVMLSGMIFPIDNMPRPLQGVSCIIPARWYIEAMRKLMIQQLDLGSVLRETSILCLMAASLLVLAIKKFNSGT